MSALRAFAFILIAFGLQAAPKHVKIVLVGDSTVNDEGGWGTGFRASLDDSVEIVNLAVNGRSTKSFRAEGRWEPALKTKPDYILIQFGHNDEPGKGPDRESTPEQFHANLVRYVDEARAAGAKPVLVTSIVRRDFTEQGTIKPDHLVEYTAETRKVAAEKNVPLMELYNLTKAHAERLGPDGCVDIDARDKKTGKRDSTHLGARGRQEIGVMAAKEFVRIVPDLAPRLREVKPVPVHVVVAADGSGDYTTIQYSMDHAPQTVPGQRLIVEIRPGTYKERVIVPQDRPRVTFLGSDAATTVITAGMSAGMAGGTFLSATVDIEAADFEAENITFENSFGPPKGTGSQAVALKVQADRAAFHKCRFLGWQDTLYAASGRQYYKDSYIEGSVDFIFGNATAVFENDEIHSKAPGYVTAHSRTTPEATTGYVFLKCRLTGDSGAESYLGRPWRPYARVVYIDTEMDAHIRAEGWENWKNPANERTAWYAELGSTGPGAHPEARVKWAHSITRDEATAFLPAKFLAGSDGWNPTAQ